MLAPDQRIQIRERIDALAKRIRKPNGADMAAVVTELEGIMQLNIGQHCGPLALFDRCAKWLMRARARHREQQQARKKVMWQ
jgi:hypothetical protein